METLTQLPTQTERLLADGYIMVGGVSIPPSSHPEWGRKEANVMMEDMTKRFGEEACKVGPYSLGNSESYTELSGVGVWVHESALEKVVDQSDDSSEIDVA